VKDYKKYYTVNATPEEVYAAITNPLTIELWTGEPAEMSTTPGTEFNLWDGSIVGKNLEFEENKKIVQQWYFDGQEEPSIVTIKLHQDNNIPDEAYDDIVEGWNDAYFGSIAEFYEGI
jgi:activator of HSP90 ATPase